MPDCEPAVAKSAAMEHVTAAEAAAVKDVAAATAAAEMHAMTAATAEMHAMTTAAAVTASAAMAAAHFGDQSLGEGVCGWRRAWTDGGQRVRALARGGRQDEYRRCGETQATHKSAPRIWNLGHS